MFNDIPQGENRYLIKETEKVAIFYVDCYQLVFAHTLMYVTMIFAIFTSDLETMTLMRVESSVPNPDIASCSLSAKYSHRFSIDRTEIELRKLLVTNYRT